MKRRTYLGGTALAGVVGLAGCYLLSGSDGDEEEEDAEGEQESEQAGVDETDDSEEDDDGGSETDADPDSEDGTEAPSENESPGGDENETAEGEEEARTEPTEEQTTVNEDEYERQEEREVEELDPDTVAVDANAQQDDGGVTVSGTVTNISEDHVDAVDVDISFFGPDDEYLGADLAGVSDLGAGESAEFAAGMAADELRGEVERIQIDVRVYGFPSD